MNSVLQEKIRHWDSILNTLPCQLLLVDIHANIVFVNDILLEELGLGREDVLNKHVADVLPDCTISQMLALPPNSRILFVEKKAFHVQGCVCDADDVVGAVLLSFPFAAFHSTSRSLWSESYENFENDIREIFSSRYDVIYSSDGQGITQKVSAACEELWGLKAEEMVGRSVYDLERTGVYSPSITRLVLETKQHVQRIQETRTGRKLLVTGTPITNKDGEIIRVVNLSRDITSEHHMQMELENIKMLLNAYKHELDELRARNLDDNKLIYQSDAMSNVVRMALKVSDVDSTVIITGESGVGKEVLASFIQTNSPRKDKPYIRLNCGAIPESLMESELFGYERGAFTGAGKEGKPGFIELANHGTLFLDEISELSLKMQVKLLRVLQEGEFVRVGGTKVVKLDVRIIAASNRNLEREVKEGRFREDLFYRLNVVPMHIPPLRERSDDIQLLAMFFLNRYNKKYRKSKTFDTEIIPRLQEYEWKGNIRELQNIVERLVVLSDKDLITPSDLPAYILASDRGTGIVIDRIMPLKDALGSLEQQLIMLALEKYGSATKAAEVLGVDQSTISRKLRKN